MVPVSVFLSVALGAHYAPFRITPLTGLPTGPGLSVHHFLSYRCTCSKNLLSHLKTRGALHDTEEVVHLIDPPAEIVKDLTARGYRVETLSEQKALDAYHLAALPQLVVVRDGRTLYQGGYAYDQQHSRAYEDERIIAAVSRSNDPGRAFPVYGCANGTLNQARVDVLNLKYE